MIKKLLCAALLAAGAASVHAAETTWNFTYKGFVDADTGIFDPNMTFTGQFTGSDNNADGIIALDELTTFISGGYTLLRPYPESPDWGDPTGPGGCARDWTPWLKCEIKYFSYDVTGQLDYHVERWGNDEASGGWGGTQLIGQYLSGYSYNDMGSSERRFNWSDQTTFTIAPPPVPEPSAALLLPAGLAVLVAARRRRQAV